MDILSGNLDYRLERESLNDLHKRLMEIPSIEGSVEFWYHEFQLWLDELQGTT